MKNVIVFLLALLLTGLHGLAQGDMFLSDNWSSLTGCTSNPVTVSGSAALRYLDPDIEFYLECPGSTVTVALQREVSPNSWTTVASQAVASGGTYSFTITLSGTWKYRIAGYPTTPGAFCSGYSYSPFFKPQKTISIIGAPSSSFKIDGITVNSSTYTDIPVCNPVQMTQVTFAGTGGPNIPGVTPAANYQYLLQVVKTGSPASYSSSWVSGTLPATYDLRNQVLIPTWGTKKLAGEYFITLWVRNGCNTAGVAYSGKVNLSTAFFQLSTDNTGTSFTDPGPQSAPASVCASSPKLRSTCTNQILAAGGYYQLTLEEFTTSNTWVQTLINTSNVPITSTASITALELNLLTNPPGYFFINSNSGKKYKATWTIGDNNGSNTTTGWFIDNIGGCKTDGGTTATDAANPVHLSVSPNPASSELTLEWESTPKETLTIKLLCADGKEVHPPVTVLSPGMARMDVSGLPKGFYFLEVVNGARSVQKIVIE